MEAEAVLAQLRTEAFAAREEADRLRKEAFTAEAIAEKLEGMVVAYSSIHDPSKPFAPLVAASHIHDDLRSVQDLRGVATVRAMAIILGESPGDEVPTLDLVEKMKARGWESTAASPGDTLRTALRRAREDGAITGPDAFVDKGSRGTYLLREPGTEKSLHTDVERPIRDLEDAGTCGERAELFVSERSNQ